jgi:hypothetical protein
MQKDLKSQKPDDYGMLRCSQSGMFSLRVGPLSVERATRIVDTLLRALEKRGFTLQVSSNNHDPSRITVNGQPMTFSIEEPSERNAHRITSEERARQARGYIYLPIYDYTPTGVLTLRVTTPYGSGITGSFRDTAKLRVEDRLNDVILSMVRTAEWHRADREKQQRRQRALDDENARRAEVRKRQQEETARLKKLQDDATAWNTAETLRRYISAVDAMAREAGPDVPNQSPHSEWLRWAMEQADRIDPLRQSPPSILDEKSPEPLSMWQVKWEGEH